MKKKNYQIIYYEDAIEIHDKEGKILYWTEDEWKEDSQVPFYICNAIQRVCENKTIF